MWQEILKRFWFWGWTKQGLHPFLPPLPTQTSPLGVGTTFLHCISSLYVASLVCVCLSIRCQRFNVVSQSKIKDWWADGPLHTSTLVFNYLVQYVVRILQKPGSDHECILQPSIDGWVDRPPSLQPSVTHALAGRVDGKPGCQPAGPQRTDDDEPLTIDGRPTCMLKVMRWRWWSWLPHVPTAN